MKSIMNYSEEKFLTILLSGMILCSVTLFASPAVRFSTPSDSVGFVVYKGKVVDHHTDSPLAFASVMLKGSNISTISNTEGAFSLKVPTDMLDGNIMVTFLGYRNKVFPVSSLKLESNLIEMDALTVVLPEISVVFSDAASLMYAVMEKKGENYLEDPALMTAFYRETIKKRKTYVSLLEAVVDITKSPYTSNKLDVASLYKVRKSTDYQKLDTLVFKLMGGPYNTLYADVMRYSDVFFDDGMLKYYQFEFDKSTRIDDRIIYVVKFKPNPDFSIPLYYGRLYIDAETLAMVSAVYSLTLTNRAAASEIFIKKKPLNAKVYPTKFNGRADYLQRDGKWYLSYSRVELDINVDWKRRLFNTLYESTMEMAVTDWTLVENSNKWTKAKARLKMNVVVADEAAGFADPAFWGDYNVIEPEKSIDVAIKKIQKQLNKKD